MKKQKLICAAAAAMLLASVTAFTGCGSKDNRLGGGRFFRG